MGNKGTLAKYRREQRNISQFLGTREQNSKNYSTKMCGKYENVWEMCVRKCVGTWEHRAILEGNKGTRTPPGRPSFKRRTFHVPNSFFAQRKIMTSSVAHFVERIRRLFSGRAHVFVLKNKIQTVLFKKSRQTSIIFLQ